MFLNDLPLIFAWWIPLFFIGISCLPLTALIFADFFDKGYIFSKILGLLLVGYFMWLLASIKILPFGLPNMIFILVIFLAGNIYLAFKTKIWLVLKKNFVVYLAEEMLFISGLVIWAYLRGHEPSIHELEKFMDFGFINSILRSTYFPPKDMWMAPLSINYYYFGHYLSAFLIKLSAFRPETGYNLMLSTLFAVTLTASFSIGANLYHLFLKTEKIGKWMLVSGGLSAFLVTLGGNLHTIYAFFQSYPGENPVPFWTLPLIDNFSTYWYPNATRFIPLTIHEFPLYSFVVADLHGHVLNLPFALLTIAAVLTFFFKEKAHRYFYPLFGLLIATSLMSNVLDGPIYLLLIFLVIFFRRLAQPSGKDHLTKTFLGASAQVLIIIILAVIISLPFWLSFKPFGSGIGVICAPNFLIGRGNLGPFLFEADHCARSPLWMLAILWGFFFFTLLSFILIIVRKTQDILSFAKTDYLALVLGLFATILIIIPELFYVKDIYPAHYRANTVFKLGYQAFVVLGLTSGYMITRIISRGKISYLFLSFFIPLFMLVLIYPYFAVNSYYNSLKNYQGQDGLAYLNTLYPSDYEAILFLNKNIQGQPVILEGQGDSYTNYGRISANTGLPTVIGWTVHEWLWRGSYDEPGERTEDVTTLYESDDIELTQQLLRQYNVSYVVIGQLEREKYASLDEGKFISLGEVFYQNDQTTIYKLKI